MAVYLIIEVEVLDPVLYAEYTASPEYLALAPLRARSTRTRAIALPGVAG